MFTVIPPTVHNRIATPPGAWASPASIPAAHGIPAVDTPGAAPPAPPAGAGQPVGTTPPAPSGVAAVASGRYCR